MKFSLAAVAFLMGVSAKNGNGNADGNDNANLRAGKNDDGLPGPLVSEFDDVSPDPSPESDCLVTAEAKLMIPRAESDRALGVAEEGDGYDDLNFVCQFPDGTTSDIDLDAEQAKSLRNALARGRLISNVDRIDLDAAGARGRGGGGGWGRITFPSGVDVVDKVNPAGRSRGGGKIRSSRGRRRMATLTGDKVVLVVIGRFLDYPYNDKTPEGVSGDIFGANDDLVNLKSQFYDCSFEALNIVPAQLQENVAIENAPGVIELQMGVNMVGMSKIDIFNLFQAKTSEALGIASASLPAAFDHVIFARETCLTECGWAAYAGINAWYQMFQSWYISSTGTQVHEMGHNLELAHSGSNGFSYNGGSVGIGGYTDHTCQMGNPLYSDEIGKMCFNPAKNYQIQGWYEGEGAKIIIDPAGKNGAPTYSWSGDLVGVGEYDKRTANNEPVTIKIETGRDDDIFVGFNRAAGPNAENVLGDNLVEIVQVEQGGGETYSQSRLLMLLDDTSASSEFSISGIDSDIDLKIKVDSIDTTSVPGKASVWIGFEGCNTASDCHKNACFLASTCPGQGTPDTGLNGCIYTPAPDCCGNEICEMGESKDSCPDDCHAGPIDFQLTKCGSCYIRDGAMFDVEAKADADLTITDLDYYAYTASGTVRLYYKVGSSASYASGTPLDDDGWISITETSACGSWKMCSMGLAPPQAVSIPRGTKVSFLLTYLTGGDILYSQDENQEDDYIKVHKGKVGNFNGDTMTMDSWVAMFNGVLRYEADMTPDGAATKISLSVECAGPGNIVAINDQIGQTFVPNSDSLVKKIAVWIGPNLYYVTEYELELYSGEFEALLATSPIVSIDAEKKEPGKAGFYDFDLTGDPLIPLAAGETYSWKLVRKTRYSGAFSKCNDQIKGVGYWLGTHPEQNNDYSFKLVTWNQD